MAVPALCLLAMEVSISADPERNTAEPFRFYYNLSLVWREM